MQKLEAKDIAIGGTTYRLNVLSATSGSDVLAKLLGMVGNPAGQLLGFASRFSGGDMDALEQEITPELASNVLGSMGMALAKPGTVPMVKQLLSDLFKNEGGIFIPVNYDVEFAANYGVLSQLVMFALKVNFESFFVGNPALRSLLQVAVAAGGNRT